MYHSRNTHLAYLNTHPLLQNETYYWTGDRKIICHGCDKIIPTASKVKQHSKGIKNKKLVDHNKNRVSAIIYQAISLSNKIESILIEKKDTNLKEFNVVEDCFNGIVNDVSEVHSALDVLTEDEQVDKARVEKAQAKQIQEMKSSTEKQL